MKEESIRHNEALKHEFVNTLRRNDRHFADDILKHIFLDENVRVSIKISLKFVPKGPIDDIPALVLIMAWCRPGDRPLSEPVMVRSAKHLRVTWPQWVKFEFFAPGPVLFHIFLFIYMFHLEL